MSELILTHDKHEWTVKITEPGRAVKLRPTRYPLAFLGHPWPEITLEACRGPYLPDYLHPGGLSCSECDPDRDAGPCAHLSAATAAGLLVPDPTAQPIRPIGTLDALWDAWPLLEPWAGTLGPVKITCDDSGCLHLETHIEPDAGLIEINLEIGNYTQTGPNDLPAGPLRDELIEQLAECNSLAEAADEAAWIEAEQNHHYLTSR